MHIETALSTAPDLDAALDDCCRSLRTAFGRRSLDAVLVFATPPLGNHDRIPALVQDRLGATTLVGCSAGGVIGSQREIEHGPALLVAGLASNGVRIGTTHVDPADLPSPDAPPSAWRELLADPAPTGVMVLCDPFTFPTDRLLTGLDYALPSVPKFGGLASGGRSPGQHRLFRDRDSHDSGAIVTTLSGALQIDTVVAQGCRPLGAVGTITRIDAHYLLEIDDRPALAFLRDQLQGLDDDERRAAERSPLFLGFEMDPFQLEEPDSGEFLIRNLVGFEERRGAVAVATNLAVGRRVRFHLRDRESSAEDLRLQLAASASTPAAQAGLLFSCLGRGEGLFGVSGHDSARFADRFGPIPLFGFFCNGEIGPVGGATHVHGYTSAFAILRGTAAGDTP